MGEKGKGDCGELSYIQYNLVGLEWEGVVVGLYLENKNQTNISNVSKEREREKWDHDHNSLGDIYMCIFI